MPTSKYTFKLRFPKKSICEWAELYMAEEGLEKINDRIPKVRSQGFYTIEVITGASIAIKVTAMLVAEVLVKSV